MLHLTNDVLFQKASNTKTLDGLPSLYLEMLNIMEENLGVGLAAPQVGISERFFIMRKNPPNGEVIMCINPMIKTWSNEYVTIEEGCLSHAGVYNSMARDNKITVAYYDMDGKFIVEVLEGIDAIIFQHEMDHLNGKTIL